MMSGPKTSISALAGIGILVLAASLGACSDQPSASGSPSQVRIVSLSPALTRTVVDLDPNLQVVGRTQYCLSVDPSIPVVGDLIDLDYERIVRLNPTHVFVQPAGGRVDDHLAALAEQRGWRLASWQIDSIEDIRQVTEQLPAVIYQNPARLAALRTRAGVLIDELDQGLESDDTVHFSGRVLLVHGVDPVRVFGQGTYLSDVLLRLGAVNAAPASGWGQLTLEDVAVLDPEGIVLVCTTCQDPIEALGPLATLDIAAVREGRLAVLNTDDALLPSTAVIQVAAELRDIMRSFNEAGP
jgi:ABC-type hemin transport system substrate-binding protein